jgi:hypothetical protein
LRDQRAELDRRGVTVLVVGFEAARRQRGYCRNLKLGDWTCLVDESLEVYHAYGLERLPKWRTFNPVSALKYVVFALQRKPLPRPRADVYQAGGDFVVDPAGRVALSHPGRSPHDRPTLRAILAALDGQAR